MADPKSILLHIDGTARCVERVRVARQLAETFSAEVKALYAVTPSLLRYPMALEGGVVSGGDMAIIDDECRDQAHAAYTAASAGSPLLSWAEPTGDTRDFANQALYCDLMLLGQRDPDDKSSVYIPPDFLTALLVQTGRPALVLPYAGSIAPIGRTVLVAWKPTPEAARAVSAALPWLRRAEHVHVISYGDSPDKALQAQQQYLQAHGVAAQLHRGGPELGKAGEDLLSRAADLSADLLVMGCYGHSRAREWVLGGATRTVLQSMTLPVLMAH
ncbi:universal stress protein [Roseateles sp.]|uniref:universal stress protein n=1 Tax=Roseateles sp. TaxID=1971397 RepID=UPI003266BDA4